MTLTAFFLILASVILHASWHFISKKSNPHAAFFVLVSFSCLCSTLPFALTSGIDLSHLPLSFFVMTVCGGVSGVICDIGLSCAYRLADVSLAYPLARAVPVLLTALVTILLGLGERPDNIALAGMAVIMAGCIMIPMRSFADLHWRNYWNRALGGILVAAVGTTGYTIFDSEGLRLLLEHEEVARWHGAAAYSCMREAVLFVVLCIYVLLRPQERAGINKALFCHPQPYFAGVFAAAAYLLVLIATGFVTNVSFVQAFRQMSLPVGVFLGIIFLKEKCPPVRLTGLALIVGGLVITMLSPQIIALLSSQG